MFQFSLKKCLVSLSLLLALAAATLVIQHDAPIAQAGEAKSEMDRDQALITLSAQTTAKLETTEINVPVASGDTYGDIVKSICKAAGVTSSLSFGAENSWADVPVDNDMELVGRPVEFLNSLSRHQGFAWAAVGSTLWLADDWEQLPGPQITRSYNSAVIEEALNSRQRNMEQSEKKAKTPGKDEKAVAVLDYSGASEYLESTIADAFLELGGGTVLAYGGVIVVKAQPYQHAKIQAFLAGLKKTLSLE